MSNSGPFTSETSGNLQDVTLTSGQTYYIYGGGTGEDITVLSAGTLNVQSGGTVYDTIVSNANPQPVVTGQVNIDGGVASGTQIYGGGYQFIAAGATAEINVAKPGSAYDTVIFNDGYQGVDSGTAYRTTISSGGEQVVGDAQGEFNSNGEFASGTLVKAGGVEYVDSGGIDYGTQVENGGIEYVALGGFGSSITVQSGGLAILAGGYDNVGDFSATSGAEVISGSYSYADETETETYTGVPGYPGTVVVVSSGGVTTTTYNGHVLGSSVQGGYQYGPGRVGDISVQSGGTFIEAGGDENGETLLGSGATLEVGGIFTISVGNLVETISANHVDGSYNFISSGVTEIVNAGNYTVGTEVFAGGNEQVLMNTSAVRTTVEAGGSSTVHSGGQALQDSVAGVLTLIGSATETTVKSGGTLLVSSGGGGYTSGGVAYGTVIESGGSATVAADGNVVSTTVSRGGTLTISGGSAYITTLSSGGNLFLDAGTAGSTTIRFGATETVSGGVDSLASISGQQIVSGGLAYSGTVAYGGTLTVDGGAATSTQIAYRGTETVLFGNANYTAVRGQQIVSGGTVSNSIVSASGTVSVFGGILSNTQINSGGVETLSGGQDRTAHIAGKQNISGGAALSGTVESGGLLQVFATGDAIETQVTSSGTLAVSALGEAESATILSGGLVNVFSGGVVTATVISSGGVEQVSGGKASGDAVRSGGTVYVSSGGVTFNTVLSAGNEYILSGGTASGTETVLGGLVNIASGGSAVALDTNFAMDIISSGGISISGRIGGSETVFSGGIDSGLANANFGTIVVSGGTVISGNLGAGTLQVLSGVVSSLTDSGGSIFLSGGTLQSASLGLPIGPSHIANIQQLTIYNNASATDVTVGNGTVYVSGGLLQNATFSGGNNDGGVGLPTDLFVKGGVTSNLTLATTSVYMYVGAGGAEINTVVDRGATEILLAGANIDGNVISGGIVEISDFSNAGTAPLVFSGPGGLLAIDSDASTATPINGFGRGDSIYLGQFDYNSAETVAALGDIVTVNSGGSQLSLDLAGTAGASFMLTGVTVSGVNYTVLTEAACYREGTLIATPAGEAPIESLNIGDHVLTLSGEAAPIRWIGRRSYTRSTAAGNRTVLPILIRAEALSDGLPRRDLWVSPEHALYIDGMLIAARDLVNGQSIIQAEWVEEISYLHLELDAHAVIFAEGAPAESFVDDYSRHMFENAAEFQNLYPNAAQKLARFCAPRVEEGWELEAVRRRLAARGHAMAITTRIPAWPSLSCHRGGPQPSGEGHSDSAADL